MIRIAELAGDPAQTGAQRADRSVDQTGRRARLSRRRMSLCGASGSSRSWSFLPANPAGPRRRFVVRFVAKARPANSLQTFDREYLWCLLTKVKWIFVGQSISVSDVAFRIRSER
jgi:hypothetical protein